MSIIKTTLCNKTLADFDTQMNALELATKGLQAEFDAVKSNIESKLVVTVPTLNHIVKQGADKARQQIDSAIPDPANFKDADDFARLLMTCMGKNTDKDLSIVLTQAQNYLLDAVNDLASAATIDIPEFDFGFLISGLEMKFNIPIMKEIPNMDKTLNCLSALCDGDIQSRMDRLTELMDGLCLTGEGAFDVDVYCDLTGASKEIKENVLTAVDTYTESASTIIDVITSLW